MSTLKLALNEQDKTLASLSGSVTGIPGLFQTNTQALQIQVVDPDVSGIFNSTFTVQDCSANQLRVVVSDAVTGDLGDAAANLLAATLEAGFAWDVGLQAFIGNLNLMTAEVAAFIGSAASRGAILEINLVTAGVPTTLFQGAVTLYGNADEGGAAAPSIIADAETVGTVAIQNGVGGVTIVDNVVTVAGLALAGAPAHVFLWINAPAGSGAILANFIIGSATADHFSFVLDAIPPNNNYSVTYVLTF